MITYDATIGPMWFAAALFLDTVAAVHVLCAKMIDDSLIIVLLKIYSSCFHRHS